MSLIKLIILIIAVYMFFRLFARFIGPLLLRIFIKRVQKNFYEQNPHMKERQQTREGHVTIHRVKDSKDNEIPPDLGDYIDYEEVKNNQNPTNE